MPPPVIRCSGADRVHVGTEILAAGQNALAGAALAQAEVRHQADRFLNRAAIHDVPEPDPVEQCEAPALSLGNGRAERAEKLRLPVIQVGLLAPAPGLAQHLAGLLI